MSTKVAIWVAKNFRHRVSTALRDCSSNLRERFVVVGDIKNSQILVVCSAHVSFITPTAMGFRKFVDAEAFIEMLKNWKPSTVPSNDQIFDFLCLGKVKTIVEMNKKLEEVNVLLCLTTVS